MPTRRVLTLTLVIASSACSASLSPDGTPDNQTVEGSSFVAASLNGAPLPVLLPTVRGCALTGNSGSVGLHAGGRFSATFSYTQVCRGRTETVNRTISGRYTRNGNQLTFAADSGFSKFATALVVTGTLSGDLLTAQSTPQPGSTVTIVARRQ